MGQGRSQQGAAAATGRTGTPQWKAPPSYQGGNPEATRQMTTDPGRQTRQSRIMGQMGGPGQVTGGPGGGGGAPMQARQPAYGGYSPQMGGQQAYSGGAPQGIPWTNPNTLQNVNFLRGGQNVDFSQQNPFSQEYRQHSLTRPEDFGAERGSIEKATYDRAMNLLQPQYDRQENRMLTDLTNRGLAPTSQAYQDMQRQFGDQRQRDFTDLSLASVMAGSQEHQRLADLASRNRGQVFGEDFNLRQQGANEQAQRAQQQLGLRGIQTQEANQLMNAQLGLRGMQGQEQQNRFANYLGADAQRYGQRMGDRQQSLAEQVAKAQQQLGLRGIQAQEAATRMQGQLGLRGLQQQAANNMMQGQLGLRGQQLQGTGMRANQQLGVGNQQLQASIANAQQALANRQQMMNEQMIQRTQPTNDLASLLSATGAGQVPNTQQYGLPAPNYMQLVGNQYASNQNRQASNKGGLTSLAGAAFNAFSDRRLKDDIEPVGKLFNGLTVYKFRYKGERATQIGLMADEVQRMHPNAVGEIGGYKTVNYTLAVKEAD